MAQGGKVILYCIVDLMVTDDDDGNDVHDDDNEDNDFVDASAAMELSVRDTDVISRFHHQNNSDLVLFFVLWRKMALSYTKACNVLVVNNNFIMIIYFIWRCLSNTFTLLRALTVYCILILQ